jgi:hypothetical protein
VGSARPAQAASPYASARTQQQYGNGGGGSSRLSAAAANSFNPAASANSYFNGSGGASRTGSGNNGNGVSFLPAPSARSGNASGRVTPNERRAQVERMAEINAVRGLQQ